MSEGDLVSVDSAELRRMLHHYNNLTARILTRAEVALLDGDPDEYVAALQAIVDGAVALGEFTKQSRATLLGSDD